MINFLIAIGLVFGVCALVALVLYLGLWALMYVEVRDGD